MKILLVSMNSIHFRRWSDQLRDSKHDVYWFDILDQGYAPSMSWMSQVINWKKGFLVKRGRTFLKKKLPRLFNKLVHKFDTPIEDAFAKAIKEIQPDLIHSFALYVSCTPIYPVMSQNTIPWVYSSWGSDLFYYRNVKSYLDDIKKVLPRVSYMFADCKRDQYIADELGFLGVHLGVFPGGGGFNLKVFENYKIPFEERKIITVKGNQNRSGRALPVLIALEELSNQLEEFEVVVFGALDPSITNFKRDKIPHLTIRGLMPHNEVIQLLCKSLIYIGNSNSDGMPNTLLEAICAGAFPIQSNPGGATAEIINDGENGLLIQDCEDVEHIKEVILKAIKNESLKRVGIDNNDNYIVPVINRSSVKLKVVDAYDSVLI